jgi:hypothetical protein
MRNRSPRAQQTSQYALDVFCPSRPRAQAFSIFGVSLYNKALTEVKTAVSNPAIHTGDSAVATKISEFQGLVTPDSPASLQ